MMKLFTSLMPLIPQPYKNIIKFFIKVLDNVNSKPFFNGLGQVVKNIQAYQEMSMAKGKSKKGLYANIHAKRKRIKAGSGERMRKPGSKGAPTAKAFKRSAKTAKKRK